MSTSGALGAGVGLTAVGSVKYNGFIFPGAIQGSVRSTPVYDKTGRAIKYVHYEIAIECVIVHEDGPLLGGAVDSTMEDIRIKLNESGKDLEFTQQGIGDTFKVSATHPDVNFGPKPQVLAMEPIGSNLAWRIQWTVAVHIAECANASGSTSGPRVLEFVYGYDWSVDEEGFLTRTIGGSIEIANRVNKNGKTILGNADAIAARYVQFPPIASFNRRQQYTLSEDKKNLSFSIVDTEIPSPNPYHKGTIEPDVTYSIASSLDLGFITWQATLSGSIRYPKGYDWRSAWVAFVAILNSRRQRRVASAIQLLTKRVQFSESLYDRSIAFNISWELTVFPGPSSAIEASNFGRIAGGSPVPTWEAWANSIRNLRDPTIGASAFHRTAEDRLVTQCDTATPVGNRLLPEQFRFPFVSSSPNSVPCPPKEQSIPAGKCILIVELRRIDNVVLLSRLASASEASSMTSNNPVISSGGMKVAAPTESQTNPDEAHYRAPGKYFLTLRLVAIRYGFELPLPEIFDLNGTRPIPLQKIARQSVRGADGPCPVYKARHVTVYALQQVLTEEIIKSMKVNPEYQGCLNYVGTFDRRLNPRN